MLQDKKIFFPILKLLEGKTVSKKNPAVYLFIQWQVFADVLVSHSRGHIQRRQPSIRGFQDRCGSWGGWITLPSPSLTWRRPQRCIGMCWGPQWVTRCPCLSTASTQCLWSSATPSWSCSILLGRKARSLASYRRTSLEGCTTFVSRWDSIDSMLWGLHSVYWYTSVLCRTHFNPQISLNRACSHQTSQISILVLACKDY